ncbi:hypothetical protein ACMVC6_004556 [Vibrio parahaemolyticus]
MAVEKIENIDTSLLDTIVVNVASPATEFVQSPLFSSLLLAAVTLAVGVVTYKIYKLQQKQLDQDAATIVYLQVREAESRINELQRQIDQFGINVLTKPFITEDSWSIYKNRIIKYLDSDEVSCLTEFFSRVVTAEEARKEFCSNFQASQDEKARIQQRKVAEITWEYVAGKIDEVTQNDQIDRFLSLSNNQAYVFSPNAPREKAAREFSNITFITPTSAGAKLKSLSGAV